MRRIIWGTAVAAAMALALSMPAQAGRIVLTGHDNDYHQSANAQAATLGALNFVRNGSSLPVLTFDAGSELTSLLTTLGIPWVNVDPSVAGNITDSLFNTSVYSAFAVASEASCGGCDNSPTTNANIAAHLTAIAAFFNAGGGIYGLAGAGDSNAYAYVPESATNAGGSPPSSGFVTTADGTAWGIPAVNGDITHNFFNEPGTGGLSSLYKVTERVIDPISGTPETIALSGGTIVCTGPSCVITGVPEPGTLSLLGMGLVGLVVRRRRKNKQAA